MRPPQCAHAACGVVQKYKSKHEVLFKQWEWCGQAKIALKIQDDDEMVRSQPLVSFARPAFATNTRAAGHARQLA